MGGPFSEAPYPPLDVYDFGPGKQYGVDVRHGGRTIIVGDRSDQGLLTMPTLVQPGPDAVQPSLLLTDGAWVWPGVLPYYVAAYHLRFAAPLRSVRRVRQWKVEPTAIKPEDLSWHAYDAIPELAAMGGG